MHLRRLERREYACIDTTYIHFNRIAEDIRVQSSALNPSCTTSTATTIRMRSVVSLPEGSVSSPSKTVPKQLAVRLHRDGEGRRSVVGHTVLRAPARDIASAGLIGRRCSRTRTSPRPGFGTGFRMTAAETHTHMNTSTLDIRYDGHRSCQPGSACSLYVSRFREA